MNCMYKYITVYTIFIKHITSYPMLLYMVV